MKKAIGSLTSWEIQRNVSITHIIKCIIFVNLCDFILFENIKKLYIMSLKYSMNFSSNTKKSNRINSRIARSF